MSKTTATLLGDQAEHLLGHTSQTIAADQLHHPGPDYIDRVFTHTDRPINVLRNMQSLFDKGRLGGSGYVSILPVDQGIERFAQVVEADAFGRRHRNDGSPVEKGPFNVLGHVELCELQRQPGLLLVTACTVPLNLEVAFFFDNGCDSIISTVSPWPDSFFSS